MVRPSSNASKKKRKPKQPLPKKTVAIPELQKDEFVVGKSTRKQNKKVPKTDIIPELADEEVVESMEEPVLGNSTVELSADDFAVKKRLAQGNLGKWLLAVGIAFLILWILSKTW